MAKPFRWNVPTEKDIEDAIIYFLNYQIGCFAFKVDTRANFDVRLGTYRAMSKHVLPGTPDILCCISIEGLGIFIGFEVKAEKGRQSQHQKVFQEKLEVRANGFYFVVRSIKEVEEALTLVKTKVREIISSHTEPGAS